MKNVKAFFPVILPEALKHGSRTEFGSRAEIVHIIHHSYHGPSQPEYVPGPTVVKPVGNLSSSSM